MGQYWIEAGMCGRPAVGPRLTPVHLDISRGPGEGRGGVSAVHSLGAGPPARRVTHMAAPHRLVSITLTSSCLASQARFRTCLHSKQMALGLSGPIQRKGQQVGNQQTLDIYSSKDTKEDFWSKQIDFFEYLLSPR